MHNATKRNIIAQRRRLTWAGSLNPGNSKSPRNRPRFNGRDRISVVIRGIRIPATMLCFGGAVPSDPPGLPSHEVSFAGAIGRRD
jgi:hypothetical protein